MSKLKVSAIHDPDNDNEALTIDTSGNVSASNNVGIGTSSPSADLHIVGSSYLASGNTFTDSTSGYFFGGNGSYTNGIYGVGTNNVAINANGSERMRIDSSGNLKFNSGFGSVTTAYGVRAWINWNGNGSTINGSGGVSSYTRAGTGDYDIYWSTTMPDTGYAVTCCSGESRIDRGLTSNGLTTTKVTMNYEDTSGNRVSADPLMIIVVR